ncbi:MAG: NHL repeat containing protein, partial [Elusimicrobia bacterium]
MSGDCVDSRGGVCGRFLSPDRTRPRTTLNFVGPAHPVTETQSFVSTATLIVLRGEDLVGDNEVVSGNLLTGVSLDQPVFGLSEMTVSSTPLRLFEGPHYVSFASMDRAGNAEGVNSARIDADGTAPDTALSIVPEPVLSQGELLIGPRSDLLLSPLDPISNEVASGVRDTQFSVDGSSFAVVLGTVALSGPDGPKELRWFSRDNVLNEEAVKSTAVVLDATPPALALSCPEPSAPAFCRVFEGVIPVRGSVADLHLVSWRLDWAPGRAATSGFSPIASGTSPVSGDLASWDASALSGYVTLRLSAEDAVANASSLTVEVYVGDPARVYALGGRKTFDRPSGVALDASSRVYVADAGRDRVFVYDAAGVFVRAYGTDGRAEPALKQPSGVALDGAGNLFVADTGNHRVVKISPSGGFLAAWGRSETKRGLTRYKPGKAIGEFRRPGALAVDAAGRVVVADTGNRRLQIIGSGGSIERVIDMPVVPDDEPEEEDDGEGDAPRSRGVPAGVAVDGVGRIYVADRKGARVVVFAADGAVVRTLTDGFEQPFGVAVSLDGKCLTVSDRELDFIRRYDEDGRRLLTFGAEGEAKDAASLPAALVMKKPLGLAFGPDGALYAADSGNGLVHGFAPPAGPPVVSVGEAAKPGGGFRTAAVPAASAEPPPSVV